MKSRATPAVLVLLAILLAAPAAQATRTAPQLAALRAAELPPPALSRTVLERAEPPALPTPALTLLSAKERSLSAALASFDEPDRARLLALRRLRLAGAAAPLSRFEPLVWAQETASGRKNWFGAPNHWETRLLTPDSRQGGLFLELDPLGPVDSPNLYQAFGFDGLNVRDPWGLAEVPKPRPCSLVEIGCDPNTGRMLENRGTDSGSRSFHLNLAETQDRINPWIAETVKRGDRIPTMGPGPPRRELAGDIAHATLSTGEEFARQPANILITFNNVVEDQLQGRPPTQAPLIPKQIRPENERQETVVTAEGMYAAEFGLARSLPGGGIATGEGTAPGAIRPFYPPDNGFLGETEKIWLRPGEMIDRYGGTDVSRYYSPAGTPAGARSLPPGTTGQGIRTFEVVKPFEVEQGLVAPAYGQPGFGVQYRTPVQLRVLLKRGILREVKD